MVLGMTCESGHCETGPTRWRCAKHRWVHVALPCPWPDCANTSYTVTVPVYIEQGRWMAITFERIGDDSRGYRWRKASEALIRRCEL
jgi:hypothetical protein